MRAHMGSGIYGLVPAHFLPIFWPRYSLFIIWEKCYKYRFSVNIDLHYLSAEILDVRTLRT